MDRAKHILSRNKLGHIQCPPLVEGLGPGQMLAWYQQKVGSETFTAAVDGLGQDVVLDLAIMALSREQFMALAMGQPPRTIGEAALVEAVANQEQPFSLTPVGLEAEADRDNYYPYLQKHGQVWRWHLNDLVSRPFSTPLEATLDFGKIERQLTM